MKRIPGQSFQVIGGVIDAARPQLETSEQTQDISTTCTPPSLTEKSNSITKTLVTPSTTTTSGPSKASYRSLVQAWSGFKNDVQKVQTPSSSSTSSRFHHNENLQLTTKILIHTTFSPKRNLGWSLDEDSSAHITTFELLTSSCEEDCRFALHQLLIMIEQDECDRFYVLDENITSAAVVFGPNKAIWSGVTQRLRKRLNEHGIDFIPIYPSNNINGLKLVDPELPNEIADKPCSLYFDSNLQVRGMVEALANNYLANSKLRIISTHPFPGCTIKVNKTLLKQVSQIRGTTWTTSCEGFFTAFDIDKLIRAFARDNGVSQIKVEAEKSPLTKSFDLVYRKIMEKEEEAEPQQQQ